MKAAAFEYHRPATLPAALALLAELAPLDGRILAGGQSLVPIMAFRLARPTHLIDINSIAGLDQMRVEDGVLHIGACVRHAAFERPVIAGALGKLLAQVVHNIAHVPIRTRGTFCGSIAHADPASEWCLVAATLGARMVAASMRGMREIAADGFFNGLMSTALEPDEMLVEVRLPVLGGDTRGGFWEFSRRAGDYAMAMALAVWRDEGGRMRDVRVGIGSVEPAPRRLPEVEAALEGQVAGHELFRSAADAAMMDAMEDHQASAAFRTDLARTAIRRALARGLSGALSGD